MHSFTCFLVSQSCKGIISLGFGFRLRLSLGLCLFLRLRLILFGLGLLGDMTLVFRVQKTAFTTLGARTFQKVDTLWRMPPIPPVASRAYAIIL